MKLLLPGTDRAFAVLPVHLLGNLVNLQMLAVRNNQISELPGQSRSEVHSWAHQGAVLVCLGGDVHFWANPHTGMINESARKREFGVHFWSVGAVHPWSLSGAFLVTERADCSFSPCILCSRLRSSPVSLFPFPLSPFPLSPFPFSLFPSRFFFPYCARYQASAFHVGRPRCGSCTSTATASPSSPSKCTPSTSSSPSPRSLSLRFFSFILFILSFLFFSLSLFRQLDGRSPAFFYAVCLFRRRLRDRSVREKVAVLASEDGVIGCLLLSVRRASEIIIHPRMA